VELEIVPLTAARMEDLGRVLKSTWGSGCWCIFPRLTPKAERELPGPGDAAERRKRAMTALARRRRAPGLLAYRDGEPVGWIAVAPRCELMRVAASKATPPVDELEVWVISCITVRKQVRGQGIAVALIRAAVAYAARHGAPEVEAYPRAGAARVHDDFAYFGTEALFRRAGFRVVRGPLTGLPRNWIRRVTVRDGGARGRGRPRRPPA